MLSEPLPHVGGRYPPFGLTGHSTTLQFGEQGLLRNQSIVVRHVKDRVTLTLIIGKEDGRARANLHKDVGVIAQA